MRRDLERRLDPACGLHHRMHMLERRNVLRAARPSAPKTPASGSPGRLPRDRRRRRRSHVTIDRASRVGSRTGRAGSRAPRPCAGAATPSSRSTMTACARDAIAFTTRSGRSAGTNSQVRVGAVRRSVPIAVAGARRRRSRSQRARPQYGRRARPARTASPHRRRRRVQGLSLDVSRPPQSRVRTQPTALLRRRLRRAARSRGRAPGRAARLTR